jgi:hypothetical protein
MLDPVIAATNPADRERTLISALLVLQILLWLGFLVHRAPRFPGSLWGTLLGIAGAALMVLPSLAYVAAKRVPTLKRRVVARVPLARILAWHVWGGVVGSVLAILHTGHRFESRLGLALTAVMLVVVFSGYAGRQLLRTVSMDLRSKQALLEQLMIGYNGVARQLAEGPRETGWIIASSGMWSSFRRRVAGIRRDLAPEAFRLAEQGTQLASSIADLEYSIKAYELLKRRLRVWLLVHICASILFYGLLAMHVWASLYFGLRWLV